MQLNKKYVGEKTEFNVIKEMNNMTEPLRQLQKRINFYKEKKIIRTKDISDGYHTFGDLYDHRAKLFAVICNTYSDKSWKSLLHDDGTMFDGDMFIVGITTSEGDYTYHYHMEYWDMFDVKVLDNAPEYDRHKPEDITRLFSLLN